jgi:hypothetical protein
VQNCTKRSTLRRYLANVLGAHAEIIAWFSLEMICPSMVGTGGPVIGKVSAGVGMMKVFRTSDARSRVELLNAPPYFVIYHYLSLSFHLRHPRICSHDWSHSGFTSLTHSSTPLLIGLRSYRSHSDMTRIVGRTLDRDTAHFAIGR